MTSATTAPVLAWSLTRQSRAVITCWALLSAMLIAGCGLTSSQQTAIGKFSTATASLGEVARKEFAQSRADVVELNSRAMELGNSTVSPDKLDQFFTISRVAIRTAACDAITQYAQLLHTLATTDKSADLLLARDRFMASLATVRAVRLDDTQTGVIGAAIAFVGSAAIEAERRQRVTEIVRGTSPTLRLLIELIQQDFDPTAEHWQLGYDATLKRLENSAKIRIPAAGIESLSISDAAQVRQAQSLAARIRNRRDTASAEVLAATAQLAAAEKELRIVMDHPDIIMEDVDKFVAGVQKLESIIRILDNR